MAKNESKNENKVKRKYNNNKYGGYMKNSYINNIYIFILLVIFTFI